MGEQLGLKPKKQTESALNNANTGFTEKFSPFCVPTLEEEEIEEVVATLKSGWITTGKKVLRFEEMFCERLQARNAIAVNSATSGWHLVAKALGIGPGDEVIIPSITWTSVANVVELLGATPVFADVSEDSLQLLPEKIAKKITSRTKAVITVHFAGAPFDLDAVREILTGTSIHLIEDAAHSLGTKYKGKEVGSDSSIAIFSFHPIKNITTGEGGMIVCNDDELAEKLRLLRFHGISKDAWNRYAKGGSPEYEVIDPGYKFNMMDIQAALGISQLPKLDRFNQGRMEIATLYNTLFEDFEGIRPLRNTGFDYEHAWHLYIVALDLNQISIDRNQFILELGDHGVGAGIHFPAIHNMKFYREKYQILPEDLPNASKMGRSIVSLPIYPTMQRDDVLRVVNAVKTIYNRNLKIK